MAYIKHEDLCGAFKGNIVYTLGVFSVKINTHSFNLLSPACPSFAGETLLAIRAPIGTQLEVPIPETVSHVCMLLHVPQVQLFVVWSLVSDRLFVCVSRSSTDKENTRSVWRVHLVPSRCCWSIRTRPVPLPLFCPSLLQMTSFRTSQHRRLPPSCPVLPPRSTQISAFSMQSILFMYWTVLLYNLWRDYLCTSFFLSLIH